MPQYVQTVAPELLIKANKKAIADREGYGSPDVDVSVVTALADDHSAEEIIAVSRRLIALAKLLREGEGGGWVVKVEGKEYELVSEALFRAAAITPLEEQETVGELSFEPKQFLEIALREANWEGSA